MIRRLLLASTSCLAVSAAAAQGCGSTNPNCIVPTAPPGTSNNQAASTAFVQTAIPLAAITALTGDVVATGPGAVAATIQAGVVTAAKMAAGAAATNVGTLGGQLTGTLPNPNIASGTVTNANLANMVAGTLKCRTVGNGSGAPQDCNYPTINITDAPYSADPTGVSDSATAINNAIGALPVTGGDITGTCGTYKINSTVNLGNGSGAAGSTRYGMRILGPGQPIAPIGLAGYPTSPCIKLIWGGAAAGTMVKVLGPLQGWGLQNLILDCASSANRGLDVISGQYGDTKNLGIINCETWGLYSETVAPFGSFTQTGALHNRYDNTTILVPSGAVGGGIVLTSNGASTSNTLFNLFTNTTVAIAGTTQTGIYLQMAAGNTFVGTHITGAAGDTSIVYDYSITNLQPANNTFLNIEPIIGATLASNTGAPGATAGRNYLYNLITTDGATYPTLSNLVTDGGQVYATQTNDNANAGNVGETVSSSVAVGSAVALTTATAKTITSISLTAGDWDVAGSIGFTGGVTTTVSQLIGSLSATANTLDTTDTRLNNVVYTGSPAVFNVGNPQSALAPSRFSLSTTTTINLVAEAIFGTSTASGYGAIRARRVR